MRADSYAEFPTSFLSKFSLSFSFSVSVLQSNSVLVAGSQILRPFFGSSGRVTVKGSVAVLFSVRGVVLVERPVLGRQANRPSSFLSRHRLRRRPNEPRKRWVRLDTLLPLAGTGGQLSDTTSVPMPRARACGSFGICFRKHSKQCR